MLVFSLIIFSVTLDFSDFFSVSKRRRFIENFAFIKTTLAGIFILWSLDLNLWQSYSRVFKSKVNINHQDNVSRVVEACFHRLTRMSNVEHVAYEDESSLSLSLSILDSRTVFNKMGTSSHWEVKSINLSNV